MSYQILSIDQFVETLDEKESAKAQLTSLGGYLWSINSILRNDFSIRGFFEKKLLEPKFSILIYDTNYIFYEGETECFFVAQNHMIFCIIHLTAQKIIKIFGDDHIIREIILPGIENVIKTVIDYGFFKKRIEKGRLAGIIIGHSRPSHYFNEILYGLWYLKNYNREKISSFEIFSIEGMDYVNLDYIGQKHIPIKEKQINKIAKHGNFFICPSFSFPYHKDEKLMDSLREKLIDASESSVEEKIDISRYNLIFWIGICTEHRKWVEQLEGYPKIIEELQKRFGSMLVIFDGITATESGGISSLENYNKNFSEKEKEIISKIINKTQCSFEYKVLVGKKAIEKIYYAKNIDFFISSYGTDSIFPSLICKKPGVTYFDPELPEGSEENPNGTKKVYKHYNIIEIPNRKIKPLGEKIAERDLSIPIEVMLEHVNLLIKKYKIGEKR